jgi:hypothetical protein
MSISSYRLGDLIILEYLNEREINKILRDHPDSIGSEYILERRINKTDNNIDIVTKIVLGRMTKIIHLLPSDISDSTVVHLRLGDVVCGRKNHEREKRPLGIEVIKSSLAKDNDVNKKYVIGKCFFAAPSSTNYQKSIDASNEYLRMVLDQLNATHFDSNDADIDLCCAVKAGAFLPGMGHFTQLILRIRNKLGLKNISIR